AAERDDTLNTSRICQLRDHHRSALCHRNNCLAAITFGLDRRNIGSGGLGHFGARDVRSQTRFANGAHINHQHLMPTRSDLFGDESVLCAFGVECPYNCNGEHEGGWPSMTLLRDLYIAKFSGMRFFTPPACSAGSAPSRGAGSSE